MYTIVVQLNLHSTLHPHRGHTHTGISQTKLSLYVVFEHILPLWFVLKISERYRRVNHWQARSFVRRVVVGTSSNSLAPLVAVRCLFDLSWREAAKLARVWAGIGCGLQSATETARAMRLCLIWELAHRALRTAGYGLRWRWHMRVAILVPCNGIQRGGTAVEADVDFRKSCRPGRLAVVEHIVQLFDELCWLRCVEHQR